MLKIFHLPPESYVTVPWKNGRGESREIAKDHDDPFRWRLTWAKLASSGAFSAYPGYARQLVLLKGGPLTLHHTGKKSRALPPLQNYSFNGAWATEADVQGSGEDFNVFTREGKARAGVYPTVFREKEDMQFPLSAQEHFIFCVEGSVAILEQNLDQSLTLNAGETFWVQRQGAQEFLNIRAQGKSTFASCLWIVVTIF